MLLTAVGGGWSLGSPVLLTTFTDVPASDLLFDCVALDIFSLWTSVTGVSPLITFTIKFSSGSESESSSTSILRREIVDFLPTVN